ncbi:MAG TPA: cbb3-type cytochrome c oxidase subunit I [Verrucomicrobiae bacterium]|nr:cbb3-type cytochrome c oxidase subunit I [Verrucomicrobiae bacterium]
MNFDEPNNLSESQIDASCRVPLLALFGGAALWLVVGLALALVASLTFHKPDMFADCPWLTYGRAQAAANDLLLYGFCVPAGLGVVLWIFARLSQAELALPLVPIAAANIWHLGVLVGVVAILIGDSTGFTWLEFPRGSSVLLFAAFMLIAISAFATFGARVVRELQPAHWFLLAALFWFPWIYSTANLLLLINHPVRGVTQAVIDWWFSNNMVFIWLGLVGIGTAFYFLPKLAGRPLKTSYYALFAFWTLLLFGTWCGIPQDAPVPAWLPAASAVASALLIVPLFMIETVGWWTAWGSVRSKWDNGSFCFVGSGVDFFFLSGLMVAAMACPAISRVTEFTWFGPAQSQLQILGFFALTMFGAIYYILPRAAGFDFPFPKLARVQYWISLLGIAIYVLPLAIGGVEQGRQLQNPSVPFADISAAMLPWLRASTTGQLLLLLGGLIFALNIFGLTLKWKMALLKKLRAAITAPLDPGEVKP